MDEIAGNTDADLSSSYFYYSDGKFHGGPVWDYDVAFGNTIQNHYPKAFIAKNLVKYSNYQSVYYNALFHNDSFQKRMSEIYENDFLPVLNQMIAQDVRNTAEQIAVAAAMDQVRWPIEQDDPTDDPWGN
ncbi:MAG: CotH kinase family protein, partial [Clostridia bacterium]|nr:CotH kinase family protein [Clostridia bacterium]